VHWLTWHQLWPFVRSWQGVVFASLTSFAALYYSPRKVLETLDWYLYRFRDRHVLAEVKNRRIVQQQPGAISFGHRPLAIEIPYTIEELSEQLKRNRSSIGKSLERLHDHDKIEPYKGGWRLK